MLPIPEAAQRLGVSPTTLRRWIAEGAPVARHGRRGRGGGALLRPSEVAAWRHSQVVPRASVSVERLATIVATVCGELFDATDGWPRRAALAGLSAAIGYAITAEIAEELGQQEPPLHPELIRLRAIGRHA